MTQCAFRTFYDLLKNKTISISQVCAVRMVFCCVCCVFVWYLSLNCTYSYANMSCRVVWEYHVKRSICIPNVPIDCPEPISCGCHILTCDTNIHFLSDQIELSIWVTIKCATGKSYLEPLSGIVFIRLNWYRQNSCLVVHLPLNSVDLHWYNYTVSIIIVKVIKGITGACAFCLYYNTYSYDLFFLFYTICIKAMCRHTRRRYFRVVKRAWRC